LTSAREGGGWIDGWLGVGVGVSGCKVAGRRKFGSRDIN